MQLDEIFDEGVDDDDNEGEIEIFEGFEGGEMVEELFSLDRGWSVDVLGDDISEPSFSEDVSAFNLRTSSDSALKRVALLNEGSTQQILPDLRYIMYLGLHGADYF